MTKHPAGPFTVTVRSYSLEQNRVGTDKSPVFTSRHVSAKGAARRLAHIIAGRGKVARTVKACAVGRGLEMYIRAGDGVERSLAMHRRAFCSEA